MFLLKRDLRRSVRRGPQFIYLPVCNIVHQTVAGEYQTLAPSYVIRLMTRHSADDFVLVTIALARKYLNLTIPLCPGNDAVTLGNQTPTFRKKKFSTSSSVNTM